MFYLWSSIQAWVDEMTSTERIYHADGIPVKELILDEYKKIDLLHLHKRE